MALPVRKETLNNPFLEFSARTHLCSLFIFCFSLLFQLHHSVEQKFGLKKKEKKAESKGRRVLYFFLSWTGTTHHWHCMARGRDGAAMGVRFTHTLPSLQGGAAPSPTYAHCWAPTQSCFDGYPEDSKASSLYGLIRSLFFGCKENNIPVSFSWLNNACVHVKFLAYSPSSPITMENKNMA